MTVTAVHRNVVLEGTTDPQANEINHSLQFTVYRSSTGQLMWPPAATAREGHPAMQGEPYCADKIFKKNCSLA